MNPTFSVLAYTSVDNGRGPGRTCSLILTAMAEQGVPSQFFIPRATRPVDGGVDVRQALPWPIRKAPWRYVRPLGERLAQAGFLRALRRANPADTVVYIWPDAPVALAAEAQRRGFVVAREMINNPRLTAMHLLERAYAEAGLSFSAISRQSADEELEELKHYDLLFSSNEEVDKALIEVGLPASVIRTTNQGWVPPAGWTPEAPRAHRAKDLKFLFMGTVEVRKGILDLLKAWDEANVDGELLLAGAVDPSVQAEVDAACAGGKVRRLGYVKTPFELMLDCDVFVFPSIEEGGPLVTLEAAGAGMPIITTPMGATRLVRNGETGLVVPASDPPALAAAIARLAADPAQRRAFGTAARKASADYVYECAAKERIRYFGEQLAGAQPALRASA